MWHTWNACSSLRDLLDLCLTILCTRMKTIHKECPVSTVTSAVNLLPLFQCFGMTSIEIADESASRTSSSQHWGFEGTHAPMHTASNKNVKLNKQYTMAAPLYIMLWASSNNHWVRVSNSRRYCVHSCFGSRHYFMRACSRREKACLVIASCLGSERESAQSTFVVVPWFSSRALGLGLVYHYWKSERVRRQC